MEALAALTPLGHLALLAALSGTRIAVAFMLLPLLAPDTVPALVRNAIFLALGIVTLALQPRIVPTLWTLPQWLALFAREAGLGLALGLLLGSVLWAFEAAGQIVDTKSGATQAQLTDPLSGHPTSLSGALIGRWCSFVFMACGGLMLWAGTLVHSFAVWPLASPGWHWRSEGVVLFEATLAQFALTSFLLAAPALVVLYAIDLALGLMNRHAPQLNLVAISMSLKGVAATLVWLLLAAALAQTLIDRLHGLLPGLVDQVRRIVVPG